jgi:hypothetical protein
LAGIKLDVRNCEGSNWVITLKFENLAGWMEKKNISFLRNILKSFSKFDTKNNVLQLASPIYAMCHLC